MSVNAEALATVHRDRPETASQINPRCDVIHVARVAAMTPSAQVVEMIPRDRVCYQRGIKTTMSQRRSTSPCHNKPTNSAVPMLINRPGPQPASFWTGFEPGQNVGRDRTVSIAWLEVDRAAPVGEGQMDADLCGAGLDFVHVRVWRPMPSDTLVMLDAVTTDI